MQNILIFTENECSLENFHGSSKNAPSQWSKKSQVSSLNVLLYTVLASVLG